MTPQEILKLTSQQAKAFVAILNEQHEILRKTENSKRLREKKLIVAHQRFGFKIQAGVYDDEVIHTYTPVNKKFGGMLPVWEARRVVVLAKAASTSKEQKEGTE